ncbi:TraB/GumN family protein [Altererythrobacter aurantiacus]|uniref:TraB/GumN family protein n=1 Tax=Parapontixanthobacter aurantiacus TaxID=1463599 RepID=A0A844ZCJ3_9SPHN|nr:TraB/GumN family protein [Parapontixanthobacter aurantiacus]MXO85264.1 TraB/GumN family protein [Parapontixanthobacter aurantiacus]
MTLLKKLQAGVAIAAFSFTLPGCAYKETPTAQAPAQVAAERVEMEGPALWRVADEDTTIYLFGTVHALPDNVQWYTPAIERALTSSDLLVTELPAGADKDPALAQLMTSKAMLPEGENLREMMSPEQVAVYQEALAKLQLPAEAFDRFEPWFAAMTLSLLPLLQQGYTPESGVEAVLETKVGADMERAGLETLEYQIAVFDEMPVESQLRYLVETAEQVDDIKDMLDEMVAAWAVGDADRLAAMMNENLDDPIVAERLLYTRNANWAEWIDERLDTPGTVFVAVGAGHLAGRNSVQDQLTERDIRSSRVQ